MAATEQRLQEIRDLETLWERPAHDGGPPAGPTAPSRPTTALGRVSAPWSLGLLGAWLALIETIVLLEPAPTADVQLPLWAGALELGFMGALLAAFGGLAMRTRWGLGASLAAATIGVGIAAACPVTGHHTGYSWAWEMAGFIGLAAASRYAATRHA